MGYVGTVELIYDEDDKCDRELLPLIVAYLQQQKMPLDASLLKTYGPHGPSGGTKKE